MNPTLTELDREWRELCRSTASHAAMERWTNTEPVLTGLLTLEAVLVERKDDAEAAPAILGALSRLAVDDDLAARTLLQALMPGLVKMASTCCSDDPAAVDELVSLAWVRIRTYPVRRPGPVAANVLMVTRKRYREHRAIEAPDGTWPAMKPAGIEPSAEDVVAPGALFRAGLVGNGTSDYGLWDGSDHRSNPSRPPEPKHLCAV